ncbi:unnamed protein product, partial [Amoebophrya sp. A120]
YACADTITTGTTGQLPTDSNRNQKARTVIVGDYIHRENIKKTETLDANSC